MLVLPGMAPPLWPATTDEEIEGTAVTGHTVVVRSTTSVTIAGPVPLAGQPVMVGAQEVTVFVEVTLTVKVVDSSVELSRRQWN